MPISISDELLGLIYNVQLNDSKWWNKTIQSFLIELVYINKTVNRSIINETIKQHNVLSSISMHEINAELDELIKASVLVCINGILSLPEVMKEQIESDTRKIKELETYFKDKINNILLEEYIECVDVCTEKDINQFITDMIFELGANIFSLVTEKIHITDTHAFELFISKNPVELRDSITKLLLIILDTNDSKIRALLYRRLNAYFCLKAGSLQKSDLDKINALKKTKPEFIVFIDTNFLFSLLAIHENPANEIAKSLFDIIRKIDKGIKIKLYIAQTTLKEAVRVIDRTVEDLSRINFTGNIIRSIEEYSLNGLMQKWLSVSKDAKQQITIGDYFEPYKNNLLTIAREYGIELFNEKKIEEYSEDERVLSDIAMQLEYEEKSRKKSKSYEQHVHDISLWYFLYDQRNGYYESITDAKYWLLTVDNRFLGFDEFRKKSYNLKYNICIHPSLFLSLLQFWIPKNDDLEKLLIEYIKEPAYFYDYDETIEKGTVKILQALSRFENVDNVSEKVITTMLLDKELRRRVGEAKNIDAEIDLIKEALITQHHELELKLQQKENEITSLNSYKINAETELEKKIRESNDLREENKILKENEAKRVREEKIIRTIRKNTKKAWRHIILSIFVLVIIIFTNIFLNIQYASIGQFKTISIIVSIVGAFIISLIDRNKLKNSIRIILKDKKYIEELSNDI